ncbi:hypothetical protein TNCV_2451081 [Trichonephila clavipes]|nr:hypothetical protein TNCV_2451081 [Trichonephila clavipes]
MYSDLWLGSTLKCHRVRFLEGKERLNAPDLLQGVIPQYWGGNEPNRTVTCIVLKATAKDKSTCRPLPR